MADPAKPATPLNVLVVDDEANIRRTLLLCLEGDGHKVVAVGNFQDAVAEGTRRSFDLAFVDLRLGAESGLDLLPALLSAAPWLKIVVVTAYASIDTAVEAMRRGASDYLPKPFTPSQIRLAVEKVRNVRSLEQRIASLQEDLGRNSPEIDFSSDAPSMRRVVQLSRQVAATDVTVLLSGESGTGKTALARAIHGWSGRAARPFGVVSCPSLSGELLESELFGHVKGAFTGAVRDHPGRIAACEGGTLLLDEAGDLPLPLQPKLLRFLQDREYERVGSSETRTADVRILAATNRDLARAVEGGTFRQDLFYRLNVVQIEVPPLRERPDDIVPLAGKLLSFYGRTHHRGHLEFTAEALAALRRHGWPGNVRELRNVVERSAIFSTGRQIGIEHLPESMKAGEIPPNVGDLISLERLEEEHIRRVLAATKSLQEAAAVLGIDQATLWRRRKQYGM